MTNWKPRRKVAFGGLASALITAVFVFAPRLGIKLTENEEAALKGVLWASVGILTTAYIVPGEPLKSEADKTTLPPLPPHEVVEPHNNDDQSDSIS